MRVTAVVGVFVVLAVVLAFPMTWMLMLALGNFGFSQYGFWDCLPAALFVYMAFSRASTEDSK